MGKSLKTSAFGLGILLALGFSAPIAAQTLPAPPTFTAAAGNGAVSLNWGNPPQPSVTAYYLYRNVMPAPTPTGTLTPVAIVDSVATPAFTDSQVTNGRTYQYLLAGFNGMLGDSSAATVTPFSAPAAIDSISVQNNISNALFLSWETPLSTYPVTEYQIYRYSLPVTTAFLTVTMTVTPRGTPGPVSSNLVLTMSPTPYAVTTATQYTDTAVGSAGVSFFYYVALSKDSAPTPNGGVVPAFSSNPALSVIQPPLAPQLSAFTNEAATPGIGTGGYGIRLIWNGPGSSEGVTAYQVLRDNTPIATFTVSTPTPTYVYDDTAIAFSKSAGLPYDYAVSARGANGDTASNTVPVSFFASSMAGPIQVTPDANGAVTVSWAQGFNGTYPLAGYRIYKSPNGPYFTPEPTPTGTLALIPTPTVTPTPFATILETPLASPTVQVIDPGAGSADGFSYWVEPFDGTYHNGNIAAATPSILVLAPTPVSTLQAAGPTGNNKMVVSWGGAAAGFYGPIQDYAVYREAASAFQTVTPTPIATVGADQSSYNDFIVGATPGTSYLYQVGAQDAKGSTSTLLLASNQVTATTLTLPSAPELLPVTGDGDSLTYSWLLNPLSDGVTQYSVYGPDWPVLTPAATPVTTFMPTPSAYTFRKPAASSWQASLYYVLAQNTLGLSQPATLAGVNIPAYQVSASMAPGSRQIQVSLRMTPTITPSPGFAPVDAYGIYRSSMPGVNFTPIATIAAGSAGVTDVNLNPGAFYYYRITARVDSGGQLLAESPLYPSFPNPTPTPEAGSATWPNTPQGFSALGGVNSATLSWIPNGASEGVTNYALLANGTPTGVTFIASPVMSPTPVIQLTVTQPSGSVSVYQVEALNAQGPSDASQSVSVLTGTGVAPVVGLTPPAGFSPTPSVTPRYPQVVWISGFTYPAPVTGYVIYSSTEPGVVTPTPVAQVSAPTSFISDPGTQGFVTSYQAVPEGLGLSADLNSAPAASVSMWPNPPVPLLASAGTSAVTLAWAAPAGNITPTTYQIFRSTNPGFTPTPLSAPFSASITSVVDSQVSPNAAYYYSMTASNASGTGSLSPAQGFLAISPPVLQLTPQAVRNQLVWAQFSPVVTPSPGAVTGFEIYRAIPTPNATPTYVPLGQVTGAAVTTYSDTTVGDSGTYLYEVAATSGQAFSALSNAVSAVVVPQPVMDLETISGDGLVQLRWTYQGAPVTSVSYTLWRKLGTDTNPFQVVQTGITGVDYTDNGLLDKTFYIYEMETVDALSGGTTFSSPVTALPAAPPVVESGTVTVSQPGNENVLSWYPANQQFPLVGSPVPVFDPTKMYPLGGYVVYQSTDGGGTYPVSYTSNIDQAPASVTYADNVPVIGGLTYTYLVQAYDAPPDVSVTFAHFSSYNVVTAFPVAASTALDLNAIRPNNGAPTVNLRLAITKAGMVTIKVYSLTGVLIKQLFHQYMTVGVYYNGHSSIIPPYPGLQWDGKNMNGSFVADGVYLITTEMPDHQEIDKVAVIK
jgi:hypothetical protein